MDCPQFNKKEKENEKRKKKKKKQKQNKQKQRIQFQQVNELPSMEEMGGSGARIPNQVSIWMQMCAGGDQKLF